MATDNPSQNLNDNLSSPLLQTNRTNESNSDNEPAIITLKGEQNIMQNNESEEQDPRLSIPFPYKNLVVLAVILMNDLLCSTLLIPFVALYVAFLEDISVDKAGYTSGLLLGAFQLGQVITGKFWGQFSDIYGRKPALIIGVIASIICMFALGIASNVYICVVIRLIHGMLDANVLLSKSAIPEIVLNPLHEARGYSCISLVWGVGSLAGPALGGFTYHVAKSGFLGENPAFIPCVIISIYACLALVNTIFFFRECNPDAKPLPVWLKLIFFPFNINTEKDLREKGLIPLDTNDEKKNSVDHMTNESAEEKDINDAEKREERNVNSDTVNVEHHGGEKGEGHVKFNIPEGNEKKAENIDQSEIDFGYKKAFLYPPTRTAAILYMVISICDITFYEVLPLWTVSTKQRGGLGWGSSLLGVLLISNGIPAVLANLSFSPLIKILGGPHRLWYLGLFLWFAVVFTLPFGSQIKSDKDAIIFMFLINIPRQFGSSWVFSSCFMLVGRSAPPGCLGRFNGIAESLSCLMRCVGPIAMSPVFAWSINNGMPFPINHHLTFILGTVPLVATIPLVIKLVKLLGYTKETYTCVTSGIAPKSEVNPSVVEFTDNQSNIYINPTSFAGPTSFREMTIAQDGHEPTSSFYNNRSSPHLNNISGLNNINPSRLHETVIIQNGEVITNASMWHKNNGSMFIRGSFAEKNSSRYKGPGSFAITDDTHPGEKLEGHAVTGESFRILLAVPTVLGQPPIMISNQSLINKSTVANKSFNSNSKSFFLNNKSFPAESKSGGRSKTQSRERSPEQSFKDNSTRE